MVLFITIFNENRKTTIKVIGVIVAIILLIIALNTYQSTTMIYWSLALVPLIIAKDEGFTKKMAIPYIIYFSTGFISVFLYYIDVKIQLFLIDFTVNSIARRGPFISINDVPHRIIDFIKYPLYTALNLWNAFPNKVIGIFVGIIILISILYGFGRTSLSTITGKNSKYLLYDSLCRYSLILFLIPLSFLPNIALKESINFMIPKFRILLGIETTVVLLLYWGLLTNIPDFFRSLFNFSVNLYNKLITSLLIILTIFATYYTHKNITNFVKLHAGELAYVKNAIQGYGIYRLSKDSKIYIIASDNKFIDYDSFFISLASLWSGPGTEMLHLAMYELGVNPDIPVIFHEDYDNLPEDKNSLIIDMRNYQKKAYKELNIPLSVKPFF